jgi:hypothetical protein
MVLHSRSEEPVLASRCTPGRQRENRILDRSRITVVYTHALWPLQRSMDFRKANGYSPARSHVRFMSCVLIQALSRK